ncbi:putative molybdenum cofactor sulfurase [Helianthus debilis subsp. tardiflorus]
MTTILFSSWNKGINNVQLAKKIYLLFAMTAILFSVWEWSGSALDEGDEASKWFTNYLGKPSRLVCFNEESETRHVDPNYASGFRVMFSDGYPFLIVSQESLDSLNERLQEPVPINRFRPKFT